jgi:hypothetical protein
VEASGITRRWGTCCNVLQPEAERQIAGHWLPSRNDPALNREATPVALRQGSLRVGQRADPYPLGDIRGAENGTPMLARRDIDATNAGIVEAALQFA